MVVVNLYPFQQTVAQPDVTETDAIENIDIGGPTMLKQLLKTLNMLQLSYILPITTR